MAKNVYYEVAVETGRVSLHCYPCCVKNLFTLVLKAIDHA